MSDQLAIPVISLPNVVFFPETILPMTIQDATCIQIIKDAITYNTPVAIAKCREDTPDNIYRPHAIPATICTAGIPHIIEDDQDEGILKIIMKGDLRIRLEKCIQEIPYPIYIAYKLPLESHEGIFDGPQIYHLRKLMNKWLESHIQDSVEREQFNQHLGSIYRLVNNIAMLLVFDVGVKQILLENSSLADRVKLLNSLFRSNYDFNADRCVVDALKTFEQLEYKNLMPH